jgi:RNA polymerase sigma-70 factor, ECF subfamily
MSSINLITEQELLQAAKSNKSYFDNLYKYFIDDVYRFSYSLLNNQHDAEDISSQTFIEFYKKLDSFEWQNVSVKYWLFRTAKNLCFKKFKIPQTTEIDENIHTDPNYEVSFVDEIMNKDLLEKVKEEIQTLTPVEQEIINLRIWEGLSFGEIAQVLEIKEDTSKKKFYRSIEKVKKQLEGKNIKSIIAIPVLFTAISQIGASPAYAAPLSLATMSVTTLITQTMTTTGIITGIKAFLATKAGIAAIVGTTAVVGTGITVGTYEVIQNRTESTQQSAQAGVTTPVTFTPTLTTAAVQPTTQAPTQAAEPQNNYEVRHVEGTRYEILSQSQVIKTIEYLYNSSIYNPATCSEIVPRPVVSQDKSIVYFVEKNKWNQVKMLDINKRESVAFSLPQEYKFVTSLSLDANNVLGYTAMSELPVNTTGSEVNTSIKTAYFIGGQKYDAASGNQTFIMQGFSDKYLATSFYTRCYPGDAAAEHVYIQARDASGSFRNMTQTALVFANSNQAVTYDTHGLFLVSSPSEVPVSTIRSLSMTDLEETVVKTATFIKLNSINNEKASFTLYNYISGVNENAKFNEEIYEVEVK